MSKDYYYSLSANDFHSPHHIDGQVKVQDYLIPLLLIGKSSDRLCV
ncbi:hypothetical protein H6G97_31940 [Nostoc flagelliforme FACHB-838]|uniref:Uncharacterized protein n=1 Tax=Nostoc flagelliforme FACHB-838 TaxID=2692904 RepID=A0ABR8DZX0_9NOSO|nr:hypothetical protein [Nostoc flagelliforme FACHB-838]